MAKPQRRFEYQARSREDVKERANMRGGGFDRFIKDECKLYKARDGKNLIRILPPTWPKARHYGYDIFINYGIGVDDQSYLSLSRMLGKPDPIAEARKVAESEGDRDTVKALQPTQRILMWVIDRMAEDEGPQLWSAPFTVDKAIINIAFDDETKEVVYIDDPDKGCDVRFYKEGQGLKTKYDASKMKLMKPGPINEADEAAQNEWLEYIAENPIPECLNFFTYEQIAAAFDGTVKAKRADDDDDEPIKPIRKPTLVKPPEQDELPFDEDEPAKVRGRARAEEPDDEAPRPSIRERLASRRKPAPDDDQEED